MLRGLRKASSNLARQDRHGGRGGLPGRQLRDLGHRRHLPRFRPLDRRQDRAHRDHDRAVPADLQRQAAADRPPDRPADHLGAGARARHRPPDRGAADRRDCARRARPRVAARPLRRRDRAPDHRRSQLSGPNGEFDAAASRRPSARPATPSSASWPSSAAARCAASSRHGHERTARAEGRDRGDPIAIRTSSARSSTSCSTTRRPARSPRPTPEVLAKYFEERKILFRAPNIARSPC